MHLYGLHNERLFGFDLFYFVNLKLSIDIFIMTEASIPWVSVHF